MKLKPLNVLVHKALFPRPRPGDPISFAVHVGRHLVPETRVEVLTFYGSLDSIEAQYPGLDYSHTPHRQRLERFPHHRRLFRVFAELNLTQKEILSLCQWEGTKNAKERYERSVGRLIPDTTAYEIAPADNIIPPFVTLMPDYPAVVSGPTPHATIQVSEALDPVEYTAADAQDPPNEPTPPLPFAVDRLPLSTDSCDPDERWNQWLREASERNNFDGQAMAATREERSFHVSPVVNTVYRPPALNVGSTVPTMTSNPLLPTPVTSLNDRFGRLNDPEVALVNVQNLEDEIAGRVIVDSSTTVTASTTTPIARRQPAGEAR